MTEKRKFWHWLVLGLLSLIWGSSYILMKKGLQSFAPAQIGSLRILITSICLLPVALKNFGKLNRNNILSVLIIGYLGNGIPAFLFPLAQTHISSSLAGMLNTLNPVFTLFIGIILYQRKAISAQVSGIILGLAGAAGLLYAGSFNFNWYGLFVVLAAILSGLSSNEVSRTKGLNGLEITALSFLLMSPMAIIHLPFSGISSATETHNWIRNLSCIVLLSVLGSAAAQAMFYALIIDSSPIFASTVTYFIPVVATLWGISDGEIFTPSMLVSVIIIFTGVLIINKPEIFRKVFGVIKVPRAIP